VQQSPADTRRGMEVEMPTYCRPGRFCDRILRQKYTSSYGASTPCKPSWWILLEVREEEEEEAGRFLLDTRTFFDFSTGLIHRVHQIAHDRDEGIVLRRKGIWARLRHRCRGAGCRGAESGCERRGHGRFSSLVLWLRRCDAVACRERGYT